MPTAIRILKPSLDEFNDTIVIRGVLSPDSFTHLQVDDYQREVAPLTSQSSIFAALRDGQTLPDVELGMRGGRYDTDKDGTYILKDPTYIIDGLQRISTAIHFLQVHPDLPVRIGAMIHVNTSKEWERDRFRILNTSQTKVSPNILLRNRREDSRAMMLLYSLSTQTRDFALFGRVAWGQRMKRGELVTALTLAKAIGILHSHKVAGKYTGIEQLVPALDQAIECFGIQTVRENVKAFFELVDDCWGIKRVQYRESAVHMRGNFLFVLARLLSDHTDFWKAPDDKRLFVEAPLKRKLASFPTSDPTVVNLAGASGKARDMLYNLQRDHVNSGKRTKRLHPRQNVVAPDDCEDEDEEELQVG